MTFVGKILVVVNVALTICIAMFAAGVHAVQKSWKEVAAKNEQRVLDVETRKDSTIAELNKKLADEVKKTKTLTAEKADVTNKWIALQRKLSPLQTHVANRENALKISTDQYTLLDAQLKTVQKQKDALDAALKSARSDNDKLVADISKLLDQKHELERKEREIKRNHAKLVKEYVAARNLLAANDIEWDPEKALLLLAKPKPAEGLVVGVLPGGRDKATLVEVSVGKDDGVAIGQNMYVYRLGAKSKFLGKIEIVFVTADRAVGTLVDDPKNGVIKKGDNVSAKL